MLPIQKMISKYNNDTRNGDTIKYIVLHYTGNKGDSAKNNAIYFNGGNRNASAHYFVSDNEIYQVVEDSRSAWSVGDGYGKYGITNRNSISIEMCCWNDGTISKNTEDNVIPLVKAKMKEYSIPIDRVVRHYDASRKVCPNWSDNNWERWINFKTKLECKEEEIFEEPIKPVARPTQPIVNNTSKLGSYEYARDYANKNLDIKDIQKKLDYLGFSMSPYGADGSFGNLTFQRVKEFQQKNNLNIDGCVGLNSIAKLNQIYNAKVEANKSKPQTSNKYLPYDLAKRLQTALKSQGFTDMNGQPLSIDGDAKEKTAYGLARNNFHYRTPVMNGAITKLVQEILSYRGYKVDIDGFFGKDCDSKLRAYQKANGLLVDGNLGLNTAKKLLGL